MFFYWIFYLLKLWNKNLLYFSDSLYYVYILKFNIFLRNYFQNRNKNVYFSLFYLSVTNKQIWSVLPIAFQFSSLCYEYDCYVISRRVGTEKKDECKTVDRVFLQRSIGVQCNECDTPLVARNFVPFHADEVSTRERDLLLTAIKKPQTIRNDHSRVTLTSFLTRKTYDTDRKTAACNIFFLLGHEIRCLRKEARRESLLERRFSAGITGVAFLFEIRARSSLLKSRDLRRRFFISKSNLQR